MKLLCRFSIFSFLYTIGFIVVIEGCTNKPSPPASSNYRYAYGDQVPDSLRDDMANFVTETMRASDQHLTTSDYEDVEDVVLEVTATAFKIYAVPTEGLEYENPNDEFNNYWKFIPYNQLTHKQKHIFNSLKQNQQ